MADLDVKKIVDAILFAADSSVPLDKLTDIIEEAERRGIKEALKELAKQYDAEERPYALSEVAGGWQIYCRPEYSKWVRELHKGRIPTRLSQAALETLAIVAYKQPIVRAENEPIRGVDSSGGRALMYRKTKELLGYFGLNFVTDLPRLEEFAEVLGLKPGELELAVEGAESVAGVVGGDVESPPPPDEEMAEGVPVLHEVDGSETSDGPADDTDAAVPDDDHGFGVYGNPHALGDRRLIDEIDEA